VATDIDQLFVGNGVATIAALSDQVDIHWIAHAVVDAGRESLHPMLGGLLVACDVSPTVIVVDRYPVFGAPVARFTGNPSDSVQTILHLPHGVMALDAVGVVFEIGYPKLTSNLLCFGFAMERQERIVVRCSFPSLYLRCVALFAALVADHLMRVDSELPLLVPWVPLFGGVRRHPNGERYPGHDQTYCSRSHASTANHWNGVVVDV